MSYCVLDFMQPGSSLSLRSFGRVGYSVPLPNFLRLGGQSVVIAKFRTRRIVRYRSGFHVIGQFVVFSDTSDRRFPFICFFIWGVRRFCVRMRWSKAVPVLDSCIEAVRSINAVSCASDQRFPFWLFCIWTIRCLAQVRTCRIV